jgi:hypothetical protein
MTLKNAEHLLRDRRFFMVSLACAFARKNIEVAIANSRGPETLVSLTEELGPGVFPQSIQNACEVEMIFLAVPFPVRKGCCKAIRAVEWQDRCRPYDGRPGGLLFQIFFSSADCSSHLKGMLFLQVQPKKGDWL